MAMTSASAAGIALSNGIRPPIATFPNAATNPRTTTPLKPILQNATPATISLISAHNGTESDQLSSTTIGKRKRSESTMDEDMPESTSSNDAQTLQSRDLMLNFTRNMVKVMEGYDTIPSVLNHTLPIDHEHRNKRSKLENEMDLDTPTTLKERLEMDGFYTSLTLITKDIELAVNSILKTVPDNHSSIAKLHDFHRTAKQLVQRTSIQYPVLNQLAPLREDDLNTANSSTDTNRGEKLALVMSTPVGNMWSSLQNNISMAIMKEQLETNGYSESGSQVPSINHNLLPTSTHLSKIFPTKSTSKVPTFAEAFPPPSRQPQILPVISDSKKSPIPKKKQNPKSTSFPLKTAMWLSYDPFASFAPTSDHLNVTVPDNVKCMVWQERKGEAKVDDEEQVQKEAEKNKMDEDEDTVEDEEEIFKKAVDMYCQSSDEDIAKIHNGINEIEEVEEKDEETILHEISDLLSDIRNKQYKRLANHVTVSSISKPDADEKAVFATATRRLTDLIARLPPSVVARIDGALDGDLVISQKLMVSSKVYKGTIPQQKQEPPASATTQPYSSKALHGSANVNGTSSRHHAYQQPPAQLYNRRPSQTAQPYAPQYQTPQKYPMMPTGTPYGQTPYVSSQQYPGRTPSISSKLPQAYQAPPPYYQPPSPYNARPTPQLLYQTPQLYQQTAQQVQQQLIFKQQQQQQQHEQQQQARYGVRTTTAHQQAGAPAGVGSGYLAHGRTFGKPATPGGFSSYPQ